MPTATLGGSDGPDSVIEFRGPDANEQLIRFLFVRSWALHSGHPMPEQGPEELTAQELLDFWADDEMQA